ERLGAFLQRQRAVPSAARVSDLIVHPTKDATAHRPRVSIGQGGPPSKLRKEIPKEKGSCRRSGRIERGGMMPAISERRPAQPTSDGCAVGATGIRLKDQ